MPTYEYRCENGHDFEEFFLKISAAKSEMPCPTCGARGERRLSAGGGLLFKGSGFYITDYGKDGKKSAASPTKKSEAGAASSASESAKASGEKSSDKSGEKSAPASTPAPAKGDE